MRAGAAKMRKQIWRLVHPQDGRLSWFNWLMISLIFLGLVLLSVETEQAVPDRVRRAASFANTIILFVFAAEYAARIWSAGVDPKWAGPRGRVRYLLQPALIADVLAFAPELFVILFTPDMASAAMFLRAFRLVRVIRLISFFPTIRRMGRAVRSVLPQLTGALGVAVTMIFLAACLLHFAEAAAQPEQFGSIPRAMWWAVITLTTVGYGDAYPVTALGKAAAGLTALAGVGIVALPTGILAGAFAQEFNRPTAPRAPE